MITPLKLQPPQPTPRSRRKIRDTLLRACKCCAETGAPVALLTESLYGNLTDFRPFQPSPPNPLELLYTSWQPPRTNKNVPIYLIEDCVDMGIWKLDSLIAMRGGDAPIRPFTTDGVFKCQGLFLGLAIEFYPQLREPTYQQVKWSLQAMKQASSNETFNYHREAVIYVLDTRSSTRPSERYLPVSSIGMTLSMGPTQPVAVT